MATDARQVFARHRGEPTAHNLQRFPIFVERLNRNRRVRRNFKERRPVRLDRHDAERVAHVARPFRADAADRPAHIWIKVIVSEEAQVFNRTARHVLQAVAKVNVGDENGRVVAAFVDSVGDNRRTFRRTQRDRLEVRKPFLFRE